MGCCLPDGKPAHRVLDQHQRAGGAGLAHVPINNYYRDYSQPPGPSGRRPAFLKG
jgi:hypothetical protein